ncbi:MAG: hypothetical protein CMK43_08940, partial [Porticoccaceae bacterium]|nr:hypothetical protein [Porticoccaceae bacterium]
HAVRLTKIEGGKGRREVDLIVVMKDRISRVQKKTQEYSSQLKRCQASLDKKTEGWFRKIF